MNNSDGYVKALDPCQLRVYNNEGTKRSSADNFIVLPPRWASDNWRGTNGRWMGITTSASGHVGGSGEWEPGPHLGKKAKFTDLGDGGRATVLDYFDIPPFDIWYAGIEPFEPDNIVREVRTVRVQQRLRYSDWEPFYDPPEDKVLRHAVRHELGALSLRGHWAAFGTALLVFYPLGKPWTIQAKRIREDRF
jgi:hypothetical protein